MRRPSLTAPESWTLGPEPSIPAICSRTHSTESADFDPRYSPTHVCDLTQIPVGDDQFDAVVCNQVLEHVRDPVAVLREIRRVLRPSGRLIYSAPLFYEEHQQPYDFYRYTQYGCVIYSRRPHS